ncbi:MAG: ribosome-binding ATPase [Thermoplasmata archaeon]|jgi:ribosome-binding ATPase YchF (GTP1/OBG family)|nr:ribosome-binding ATPase [Thermoplasmata archaeon]
MLLGLVGKPNVGKSTFFTASTRAPAEIANYPFTTIAPNRGVAYLRATCPHPALGLEACTPRTGKCVQGTRWIPAEVLDVAGLVPDAHSGKGMGNKFLDDLRSADVMVHVVDASGATDAEGNPVPAHSHDPAQDVAFLERELDAWIGGIIGKDFAATARGITMKNEKPETVLAQRLTGLGIKEHDLAKAIAKSDMPPVVTKWGEEDLIRLGGEIRRQSKPILLALNKADSADPATVQRLAKMGATAIPTSANAEMALRKAAEAGIVRYEPGDADFTLVDEGKLNAAQKKGLEQIREKVMRPYGGTGVQKLLEEAVYRFLDRIVVYPVEDETHFTDKEGRVLPDAHLMRKGATARDLAYKVHTDLGENFIRGVNGRTKRVVGADYALENGDVLRIVAGK